MVIHLCQSLGCFSSRRVYWPLLQVSPVPGRVLDFDNFMDWRRKTITRRAKYAVWMDWSFSRANVVLYSFRFSHESVLRCYWSVLHQAQVHSQTHSKADKLVLCNAVLACRNRGRVQIQLNIVWRMTKNKGGWEKIKALNWFIIMPCPSSHT